MILTTTGNAATVTITGLRAQDNNFLVLTHPQTINLLEFYDLEDIQGVEAVIQAEIDANTITAQTENGDPITDVAQSFVDLAQINADIAALESDQAAQDLTIGVNQTTNTTQQGEIDQAEADIDALEVEQATQDTNISNLQGANVTQQADIDQNEADIATEQATNVTQQSEIDAIEAEQTTQDSAISQNSSDITAEETARQAADTNLQNEIDAAEAVNTTQQSEIDALEASETTQQAEIDALETENASQQTEIDNLETEQTTQNTNISQNASDISQEATDRATADTALQNEIDAAETDIDNLEAADTAQDTAISNNTNTNTSQQSEIDQAELDIDNLETSQTAQDTAIASNTSTNTSQQAEIDQAEVDIDNIEIVNNQQDSDISGKEDDLGNPALNGQILSSDTAGNRVWIDPPSGGGASETNDLTDWDNSGVQVGNIPEWNGSQYIPVARNNGFTIFPIWAEENGGIANGAYEWSFGNGATGNDIGIPIAVDCTLFAASFNADVFGTSVSMNLIRRRAGVNTTIQTSTFTANNTVDNFTPIEFLAGDTIVFQTNTVVGGTTDARICAWFREVATITLPTTDISNVTQTGIGFTATAFTDVPGMSTTVTLSNTGRIVGEATYSAARAGGANAIAQFRVVINNINGQAYQDTLSTFNDVGSLRDFVEGIPAGTYEVKIQASTTQPITISTIGLKATAVEN